MLEGLELTPSRRMLGACNSQCSAAGASVVRHAAHHRLSDRIGQHERSHCWHTQASSRRTEAAPASPWCFAEAASTPSRCRSSGGGIAAAPPRTRWSMRLRSAPGDTGAEELDDWRSRV